jgi:putative peptidoglycan lipid II flippase
MVRLVYERGQFGPGQTILVGEALFWFAFALPFNGLFLLLTRTFFSLQRPWVPTAIASVNLVITAGVALALYGPYGIEGIVAATVIATAASVFAQIAVLRRQLRGLELGRLASVSVRVAVASAALGGVSYLVWSGLDGALGESLVAQIASLAVALAVGGAVYTLGVLLLGVPEAHQVGRLIRRRA